ncbi:hypothetical protein LOTGIDRAFT_173487 [Lottia gigantea]|uniref:Tyr recombinase domain-containing protein n=1 Tax=Lottia gigantea TaxID=225164 RepID=V4CD56_LOTGI|nr:hypothetical protein LOTGIDRAFT_173487 [Lottia gigantea]ESO99829.1 hypothetical protein LOTGIDRAFT_173487 [Lottia gigantea]
MSQCLFNDNDDEDIILSQNLDDIEKELAVKNDIEKDVDYGELNLISTAEEFVKAEMEKESDCGEFNVISTAEEQVKEEVKSVVVERFQTQVSQFEIDTLIHSQTNANTRKNTKWSLNIFNEWRKCRSKGDNDIPELQDMTAEELDYCQRCLYTVFKTYLDAIESGMFYRKPLQNGIRYGKQPVGINKLGNFMKEMCQQAGLVGNYTNHSGKKICATEMYRNGQDEQSIMERTGHRSVEACRVYKIKSDELQKQVSSVLEAPISAKESSEPVSKKAKISVSPPPLKDTRFNELINTCGPVHFNNCKFTFM